VSTQTTTILLALSLAALACSANRVDLDAPVLEPGNEPSVLGLVRERVEKLAVDGERLFWSGTRVPRADGANAWFLRSCQKRDCAATLVTYDSQPYDAQMHGTGEFMSDFFAVSGGQIYWYRSNSDELVACPVTGCIGSPRKLADLTIGGAVFHDDRVYFCDQGGPIESLSVLEPEPRQPPMPVTNAALTLAVQYGYVYWLDGNGRSILRTRTDGAFAAETIANDVTVSAFHDFRAATDATSIYWTNNVLAGSIRRCPLAGCSGASDVVIAVLGTPQSLLIDGSELYYQHEAKPEEFSLSSCSLPDCAQSLPLVDHLDAPAAFALDDQYLYVATGEQDLSPADIEKGTIARIRRLPKPHQELP